MTEGALNSDRLQRSVGVEKARQSKHGIGLQQSQRSCRIVEIYFTVLDLFHRRLRQSIRIHFETGSKRRSWAQSRPDAAEFRALDRFVQLQLVAPERFVAEGIE